MSEEIKTSASFSTEAAPDDAQTTQALADVQSGTATFNDLLARLMAQCVQQGKLYERMAGTSNSAQIQALAKETDDQTVLIQATRAALAAKLETVDQIVNTLARRVGAHQRDYQDAREFMQHMVTMIGAKAQGDLEAELSGRAIDARRMMVDFLANH